MKISSLFFLLFVCLMTTQTYASTFTVNQSGDAGDLTCDATCTLRDAVDDANNVATDDTINFAAGITNIILTNEIVINGNNAGPLTITGPGADVLTIDGGSGTNRIFSTSFGAVTTISGVTLTGGNGTGETFSGLGGAIFVRSGRLVLNSVHVTENILSGFDEGGGVFFNIGTNNQILNSTFSNNSADDCGGFFNGGTLTVTNSTISGNTARGVGGGFCGIDTTLRSVTLVNNSSDRDTGNGIYHYNGTLNMGNTIVAGWGNNRSVISTNDSTIITAGYNLISNNTNVEATFPAGTPNASNDIVGTSAAPVNPVLGPLQNNGGTTPTHALLFGSPAIDTGNNCVFLASCPSGVPSFALLTDQRGAGFTRSADGNGDSIQIVDIGAFEVQLAPTAAAVGVGGRVITATGRGIQNVVVTMTDSEGNIRTARSTGFGYYRFDDVMAGETYVLSVRGKRYNFTEQTQVHSINEETNNIDFIGYSEKRLR